MKKAAVFLALLGTLFAGAQTKDTLRLTVNGNEIIILTDNVNNLSQTDFNAIIQRLTAETQRIVTQYNQQLTAINTQQSTGAITAKEAERQRDAATDKMEEDLEALNEEIENWAERYGEQVEEDAKDATTWKNQWETNAEKFETTNPPTAPATPEKKKGTTVIIDDEGVRIDTDEDWDPELRLKKEEYKRNQTIGYFETYLGWNNWFNANGMASNEGPDANGLTMTAELNFWPSMTWGFGFGGKTRFGESKMYVRYGTQFNWHYFQQKGNTILTKQELPALNFNGIHFVADNTRNYAKTTYRITYWDFPLLLEFDASKPGKSNGFSLAAGGYGGFRISSRRILKYSDYNGDYAHEKLYNNFYTNGFRYGVVGQIGFGTFKITGKYDLSTLFRDNRTTPDYQVGSITLGWVVP